LTYILFLVPGILAVAFIAWIYFDATELGKPAIGWVVAIPALSWLFFLPVILYVIFRESGHRRIVAPGAGRRQIAFVGSFTGLTTFAYGITVAAAATIARVTSSSAVGDNTYRDVLASAIAAMVVGGIIWAVFWSRANSLLNGVTDDREFWATFYLYRAYIYTVIGASLIGLALASLWFLAGLSGNAMGVNGASAENWTWALGPILVGLAIAGFHYVLYLDTSTYRDAMARFLAITPPPEVGFASPAPELALVGRTAEAADPAAYCGNCGAPAPPGETFCRRCGQRLADR
jgi:hypothetical protein